MRKEIKFFIDWNVYGVIINNELYLIDYDTESFIYKGVEFNINSDIEKDLCNTFSEKFIKTIDIYN